MSGHHFFAQPDDVADGTVVLRGAEAHHAGRVLRVRLGERITVADGSGRIVEASVTSIDGEVTAAILSERFVDHPRPSLTLLQAVTKSDKLELVVEKATEVGVERIAPYVADRTIVRWDERKLAKAHDRLQAIALAAAKQSRSPRVPVVDPVRQGADVQTPAVVLHEGATTRLRDALPDVAPERLSVVVGPEGGLSDDEVAALEGQGAVTVSLGPRILRTETAGPVAAALIAFRYGQMG